MFLLSILLILFSSYLFLSIINNIPQYSAANSSIQGKTGTSFLYFLIISFSQIVLSFEILSLLKMISTKGFIICNIIFALILLLIFKMRQISVCFSLQEIKNCEIKKILSVLKKDKLLAFLSVCFILFLIFQLITAVCFPVTFGDALTYYLPRCTSWIQNGSIAHFITPDSRELIMPVNMEFLYTWLMLFTKNEQGCAIFSYISFIGAVYILYNFLKEIGFSIRSRLWSVFVFSSFALIAIEMYTPSADLFTGTLILACIYLFLKSVKHNDKISLYFASLSYALAIGTKTTAIIAIPSVFIVLLIFTYLYKKDNLKKYILTFTGLFLLNFLIFSSYNYILNIIQFKNPVSNSEQLLLNQFRGGFKGWLCNLIKYIFPFFDISGIKDYINYNGFITYIQSLVLGLIGETDKSYTSPYFSRYFLFNSNFSFMTSFLGIMGLFAFLPSVIKSVKKYFKNRQSKKTIITVSLTLSLIINLIIFSRVMVFTQYNMRYLLTFVIIASPVIAYSYIHKKKSFFKILLCIFMFIYFVVISSKIPESYFIPHNKSVYFNLMQFNSADEINIYNYFINKENTCKIGLIISQVNKPNYYIEKLKLNGYNIEKILPENIEDYDISKYDYIITNTYKSLSTNIKEFTSHIKYPQIYRCLYYDYKQAEIYDINTKPAMVECEIPFDYLQKNGFTLYNDIILNDYFILKKI